MAIGIIVASFAIADHAAADGRKNKNPVFMTGFFYVLNSGRKLNNPASLARWQEPPCAGQAPA